MSLLETQQYKLYEFLVFLQGSLSVKSVYSFNTSLNETKDLESVFKLVPSMCVCVCVCVCVLTNTNTFSLSQSDRMQVF